MTYGEPTQPENLTCLAHFDGSFGTRGQIKDNKQTGGGVKEELAINGRDPRQMICPATGRHRLGPTGAWPCAQFR